MKSDNPNEAALWSVVDTNAVALKPGTDEMMPRVHEVAPGKRYSLYADRQTPMPEQHARLFLKDTSFVVRDADDNIVRPLTEEQLTRVAPQERLAPNLVIADLSELTDAALKDRAMVLPRSSELPPSPDRAVLIDFLQGIYQIGMPRARGNDDAIGDLESGLEAGTPDEAARILGDG